MIPQSALYVGRVMHMRLQPRVHQFRYRVFSLLLDIDRMAETLGPLWLVRLNRFGCLSFYDRDHGPRDGSSLRTWVEAHLAKDQIARPDQIFLLSFPRVFGIVFNPLSVFFCYRDGALDAVIYEVKNTFGDQIAYVIRTDRAKTQQHMTAKGMYVSPFIEMAQTYRFTLAAPGKSFALRIKQAGAAGETLIATHNAEARQLSDRTVARALITHPLMTLKVVAGIHWEALRLFLKGVRFNRYSKSIIWAGQSTTEEGSS